MDHREAIETMASERYLLDELSPEQRDAYEEHLFGCTECASDAMLGAAFVDRAKTILPTMVLSDVAARTSERVKPEPVKREWFAWLRPAIMVPFFASLLGIIAYQNIVLYPALQLAANEPQILPAATVLHGDTRSGIAVVHADSVRGSAVEVEVPDGATYSSYKFDFYSSNGKLLFTRVVPTSRTAQDTQVIFMPGHTKPDTYKLALSAVTLAGETVAIRQQLFELRMDDQEKK